jgi:hypothetical protein
MTREEELQMLKSFIDKNGVKQLPPDQRGPEMFKSVWTKNQKKIKKALKVAKKAKAAAAKEKA